MNKTVITENLINPRIRVHSTSPPPQQPRQQIYSWQHHLPSLQLLHDILANKFYYQPPHGFTSHRPNPTGTGGMTIPSPSLLQNNILSSTQPPQHPASRIRKCSPWRHKRTAKYHSPWHLHQSQRCWHNSLSHPHRSTTVTAYPTITPVFNVAAYCNSHKAKSTFNPSSEGSKPFSLFCICYILLCQE